MTPPDFNGDSEEKALAYWQGTVDNRLRQIDMELAAHRIVAMDVNNLKVTLAGLATKEDLSNLRESLVGVKVKLGLLGAFIAFAAAAGVTVASQWL